MKFVGGVSKVFFYLQWSGVCYDEPYPTNDSLRHVLLVVGPLLPPVSHDVYIPLIEKAKI